MYSFGEIRRQAYLLQKKLNLLPERNKIVDAQEEDMGRVRSNRPQSLALNPNHSHDSRSTCP
jgi:hypothetical protein